MGLQEAIQNIWSSDYVQKNPNKAYKTSYGSEYAAVAAYLNGGAEPDWSGFSKMGKGLCEVEKERRGAVVVPPDPIPPDPIPPDPVDPPPVNWSGPVTITAGGNYNGSWEQRTSGQPAVTINTSQPVTITGRVRSALTGDGGPIIRALPGAGARLTVEHVTGSGVKKGFGRFLQAEGYNSLVVRNCTIDRTGGIDVRNGLAGSSVLVTRNMMKNVQGIYPRASNPSAPSLHRQFCQLNGLTRVSPLVVSWNQVLNYVGESQVEDTISMYGGTTGAVIENNYLQGGYAWLLTDKHSGDGIIVGDGAGNNNSVRHNQIVSGNQIGIGIEGGTGHLVEDNRIVHDGRADNGQIVCAAAYGLFMPSAVGNAGTFRNNYVGWMANSNNSGDPLSPGTLRRSDTRISGVDGANPTGTNTFAYGNHSTPITAADEQAEWDRWVAKLASNNITLGA